MPDSNRNKPPKPYPGFPLFAHASGRWAKKINGELKYFGYWNKPIGPDWQTALKLYEQQKDRLHAGLPILDDNEGAMLKDMLNHWLTAQQQKLELHEIGLRSFKDYKRTAELLTAHFGRERVIQTIAPHEFDQYRTKLSSTRNVRTLGNEVNRVIIAFNYGHAAGFLKEPMRFGKTFKRPSKATIRKHRAKQGKMLFTPGQIRQLVDAATPPMAAMILLGINMGFGPTDCATLTFEHLDLEKGWYDHFRQKTGIERKAPLWSETGEALYDYLQLRKEPANKEHANLVFLTKYRLPWIRENDNAVSKEFAKLAKRLEIKGTFYWLRHTFETIAGDSADQVAVNHVMGHADNTMAGEYRELIRPERLENVVNVVRDWVMFDYSTRIP